MRGVATRVRAGTALAGAAWLLAAAPPALAQGLEAPGLALVLDETSKTALELRPEAEPGFSFLPAGGARDGYYRLGDLDIRLRRGASDSWEDFSTALSRIPVRPLDSGSATVAAADITASLGQGFPLRVERHWSVADEGVSLSFVLTNPTASAVEIGGLGMPMAFDNVLTGRSLEQAHEQAVFYDPYVGLDAGYVQVTRLNGEGPALLVLPQEGTRFEEFKPILDAEWQGEDEERRCVPKLYAECTERGITFEGHYGWMAVGGGHLEDWAQGGTWNETSTMILAPGETRTVGLRFLLADEIRQIDQRLIEAAHPVAVGLPGYILPVGSDASLFVSAAHPIDAVEVTPAGALTLSPEASPSQDWTRYSVRGEQFGKARVTLRYEDGSQQTLHYFVSKPLTETMNDLGEFLFTRHWLDEPDAPFNRGPAIMSYDRETDSIVRQDNRVWIAGLSDEGGAGAWLAAIAKQLIAPDPEEVAKFERFYSETVEGKLQYQEGELRDGVRKSLFWYDPASAPDYAYDDDLDWDVWSAWDKEQAASVVRSFNYVHVAAAQWILYRLARNHEGLVTAHDWEHYLDRAYRTSVAMVRLAPRYAEFGQMEGDVFVAILEDLKHEGMAEQAADMEAVMRQRADHWRSLDYPFGSEMPWDSTGQPEVHAWMRYFGADEEADSTREVILAYDPLIPHWGYNGSARRYWDFQFAGKTQRIERQLHHYGSALNAVPLFADYRRDPEDFHLLRVAYGGLMGPISNIDEEGFGAAAFHSFPDMRRPDGYSGDYGMGFFGHAFSTASYVVDHQEFGWLGFGGEVEADARNVTLRPSDSGRMRVFLQPAGLWLTLDAGKFQSVVYNRETGDVTVTLEPGNSFTPTGRLRAEVPTGDRSYKPSPPLATERGAWTVPLDQRPVSVTLTPTVQ